MSPKKEEKIKEYIEERLESFNSCGSKSEWKLRSVRLIKDKEKRDRDFISVVIKHLVSYSFARRFSECMPDIDDFKINSVGMEEVGDVGGKSESYIIVHLVNKSFLRVM